MGTSRDINDYSLEKPLICWVAHESSVSGANIAMLEYVRALECSYKFHIILPHIGTMSNLLTQHSIPFTIIPQYGWAGNRVASFTKKLRFSIRTFIALSQTKKIIDNLQPSLVFTNTLVPFIGAKAAFIKRIPHVWWIHEFGEEDFGFGIGLGNPKEAFAKMHQWSKLIICNSRAVHDKFKQLMPAARIDFIYQPVSWNQLNRASSIQAEFIMFGQITPSKGHNEVIDAIILNKKKGANISALHIVGPCENETYFNQIEQKIQAAELQDFIVLKKGFFKKEEVLPFYKTLIVASPYEAFGRVIVEANKAGLRVVVKNGGGGSSELINETNGLLYNDLAELANILSGVSSLPTAPIIQNYDELAEIERLKKLLNSL